IPRFVGAKASFAGSLTLTILSGKKGTVKVTSADIASVTPFEQKALGHVNAWLAEQAAKLDAETRLRGAERALDAVFRFHVETRERPAVGATPWDSLQRGLNEKLLDVRRQYLILLVDKAKEEAAWQKALGQGNRLVEMYRGEPSIAEAVRRLW